MFRRVNVVRAEVLSEGAHARTSRIARTNRIVAGRTLRLALSTLEPVFWLRTVSQVGRNSPELANAFPSHRDSGIWRTTNVHHSGASAADSHRLPNTIAKELRWRAYSRSKVRGRLPRDQSNARQHSAVSGST